MEKGGPKGCWRVVAVKVCADCFMNIGWILERDRVAFTALEVIESVDLDAVMALGYCPRLELRYVFSSWEQIVDQFS